MRQPKKRRTIVAVAATIAALIAVPAAASAASASDTEEPGPVEAGIFVEKVDGLQLVVRHAGGTPETA